MFSPFYLHFSLFLLLLTHSELLSPNHRLILSLSQAVSHSRQTWLLCPEWHHRHKAVTGKTGGMRGKRGIETIKEGERESLWGNQKMWKKKGKTREWEKEFHWFSRAWMDFTEESPTNTHTPPTTTTLLDVHSLTPSPSLSLIPQSVCATFINLL